MNYYFFSAIVDFLTCLAVSCLVFMKNKKVAANRAFIVFSASVALWAFGYAVWQKSTSAEVALFWITLK